MSLLHAMQYLFLSFYPAHFEREPERLFLKSVCRKWRLRRWSDGLMMAAHRTMRPNTMREAFPLSSF